MEPEECYQTTIIEALDLEILIENLDKMKPFCDTNADEKTADWIDGFHYGLKAGFVLLNLKRVAKE